MKTKPIERHSEGDRGYKDCLCSICKIVAKCTPRFDFYTVTKAADPDLLVCQRCFGREMKIPFMALSNYD